MASWRRQRAQQADGSRRVGTVIGNRCLAQQCLDDRRAKEVRDLFQFRAGTESAPAGENGDLLSLIQNFSGLHQIAFMRQARALRK